MPTPMRTLKLVNKIKKSGVVKQGSMKKENKYLKMLGTKATVMHPTTKVAKKVDKADVRKYVQKGWIHMTTKKNQLRKEDASNRSADKKPEKYIGPDGKTKIRMVPVDKEIKKHDEGYVSHAQRKAVWANRADGGKGHPDKKGKKEATIPQGKTVMTKRPEPTDKDKRTISKIQDLMKRANEEKVDEILDSPKTYNSYMRKNKTSARRAHNDRTFGRRSPEDNKRNDKILQKRDKGRDMADRARNRTFNKQTGQGYVNKPIGEIARSMTPMRDKFGKSEAERRKDNAMARFKAAKDDARHKMKTAKNSADMVKQMNRAQSASKAVKRISRLRDWMEK